MQEDALAHANLFGFVRGQRAKLAPGTLCAISRIVVIVPLPLLFKHITDRLRPAKDVAGIGWICFPDHFLLGMHQILSIRGLILLAKAASQTICQLRGAKRLHDLLAMEV